MTNQRNRNYPPRRSSSASFPRVNQRSASIANEPTPRNLAEFDKSRAQLGSVRAGYTGSQPQGNLHVSSAQNAIPNETPLKSSARINEIRQRRVQAQLSQVGEPAASQPQRPRTVSQQHGDRPYMGNSSVRSSRNQANSGSASARRNAHGRTSSGSNFGNQPLRGSHTQNRPQQPRSQSVRQGGSSSVAQANIAGGMWSSRNQQGPIKQSRSSNGGRGISGGSSSASRSPKRGGFFTAGKFKAFAAVLVVLLIVSGVDGLINGNKIYAGVTIGDVAVGGMTKEEASSAVSAQYSERVSTNSQTFYASDSNMQNPSTKNGASTDEQIVYEQSMSERTQWTVNASYADAVLDVDSLVEKAFQAGREEGGLFGRLSAQLTGWNVPISLSFNEQTISQLSKQMTDAVGTERVNYDIKVEDGNATVTDGHDGNEVTVDWLVGQLDSTLLGSDQNVGTVLEPEYQPLQVSKKDAQKVADTVNKSISQGATFTYGDQSWTATASELGGWISTEVVSNGASWQLKPKFDISKAKSVLLSSLHSNLQDGDYTVSFDKDSDGGILVSTTAKGSAPVASEAIEKMNSTFFVNDERKETPSIEVSSAEIPSSLSLDDARAFGLVEDIYSFSTQYSSGNEARVTNIHTAANLLNNSICKAGGTWSFNDIAGEATEDKGYQAAHAIVSGDYSDAIGGGICQVATTVFNSVYMAGYPIPKRYNHTLYISTYPTGRDAAIAYPDMDLVWKNDSSSDVLLVMSYTNSSVTATLVGISPEYQVSTETGEWKKGATYSTTYKSDDTVSSGVEYVESEGTDGSSITIVRTVKSKDGNVLHTDTFESNYSAKNKVIVRGTK